MPAAETVLLPICVALSLLGVIVTGVAWRRRRTGRALQGVGLVIAPIALYLAGLLRLVWDFVVSVVTWVGRGALDLTVWTGLGLLGLAVVLWVVGGILARRAAVRRKADPTLARGKGAPAVGATSNGAGKGGTSRGAAPGTAAPSKGAATKRKGAAAEPADPEMAEIEALLKSRGID